MLNYQLNLNKGVLS